MPISHMMHSCLHAVLYFLFLHEVIDRGPHLLFIITSNVGMGDHVTIHLTVFTQTMITQSLL